MSWELRLLGCWQLRRGDSPQDVGIRQQRLIAALALLGPRARDYLAGLLWPDSGEPQAAASLRATVFRVSHQLPGLLAEGRDPLCLSSEVSVDAHGLRDAAQSTLAGTEPPPGVAELLYSAELLPGWYEDWLLYEQERLRQLRLAALEALAAHRLGQGRPQAAIAAATHAIGIEPLDESAQALLIRAQVSAGNEAGAHRTYEHFRQHLAQEMGIEPSARLVQLLPHRPPPTRRILPGPRPRTSIQRQKEN